MRRHRHRQIKENKLQKIHRTTTEAREFITAAIAGDREIASMIELATPTLPSQLADIWAVYLPFLRDEFGDDGLTEHWQLFCEHSTVRAELETS